MDILFKILDTLGCFLFGHNKITKKVNNKKELFCETCKSKIKNGHRV